MHRRQPLPRLWLFTDERQGEALWAALARLPRGAGVVFRHYSLAEAERRMMFEAVRRVARRRRLLLILAGSERLAFHWRADGSHGRSRHRARRLRTAPVHNLKQIRAAEQAGAALLFLSPVFATRSHPCAAALGRQHFALLARTTRLPVVALGGMTHAKSRTLRHAHGWAGIDAWSAPASDQKRKAVPT